LTGGANWTLQTSGTTNDLWSVSFTDANNGTAVGYNSSPRLGIILRTTDGGINWISQTSGTTQFLWSVSFTDANNGTAVGNNGTILRTTNGGTNWTLQTSGTTNSLYCVLFTDLNIGTAIGANGTILRTTNGGTDWTQQSSGTTLNLVGVSFTDSNIGTVVGRQGIILRTTDGGVTWTSQISGILSHLQSVCFTDSNNGTVVGDVGVILSTPDGGINWIPQSSGTMDVLWEVSFTDSNVGTVVGQRGTILRTTDGGTNWISQSSRTKYLGVSFTDSDTGTVAGWGGTILRTTDGGTSWTLQPSGTTRWLGGISFVGANNGTTVGEGGTILRTTDGGANWIQQTSGTTNNLYGVTFSDVNTGTAVGDVGVILRTTNSGTNWALQSSGTTHTLLSVSFSDVDNGTAVGDYGTILRTTDGGTNWTSQSSSTLNSLRGVYFTDENNGTAVGDGGIILRAINGGAAWIQQTSGTTNNLYSVSFNDMYSGTAVGDKGTILRTSDRGINWLPQLSGTTNHLYSVSFIDANTGTTVGWDGTILRTTNGGIPPPTWSNEITVEDAGGTESSEVLTFGQHIDATDSIDASLGEYELPPPPFTGNFDSRYVLPTNPELGSLLDYRDSNPTEILWKLTFQPGSAGYPMSFSWDSTSFPEGTFYLKDRIDGSFVFVNMKNQSSYVLTNPVITSLNINYKGNCSMVSINDEWNMLSVPVLVEDMALSNLFPTATSSAYGYDGSYVEEDTLATGKGYWLKFGPNEDIQICGALLGDTVQVNEGWNMFGVYEENIFPSQITTTPSGIIATHFFGYEDGYNIAYTLQSGKGYWVRVTEDGVFNLHSGDLLKGERQGQTAEVEEGWGRIKITDSAGKSITLYVSEEEMESDLYELPPIPPTGIFDARYSSGRIAEDLISEKIILISSDKYPITIRAEGLSLTVRDRINGKLLNEELNTGEELTITNNKITSIEVTGTISGGLPVSYELYQNYPNPFNPSTTIKFAIPKESNVNLSIYNVLGELVSTLVNEEKKPGYYKYKFNASAFASGVYLYRIKAGSFIETKKMVLMK